MDEFQNMLIEVMPIKRSTIVNDVDEFVSLCFISKKYTVPFKKKNKKE